MRSTDARGDEYAGAGWEETKSSTQVQTLAPAPMAS